MSPAFGCSVMHRLLVGCFCACAVAAYGGRQAWAGINPLPDLVLDAAADDASGIGDGGGGGADAGAGDAGGVTGAGDAGGVATPDGGVRGWGKAQGDPSPRPLPVPMPNHGGGFAPGGGAGSSPGFACSAADQGIPPAVTVATSFLLALLLAGRRRR
jgi:hypothetical protein